MIFIIDIMILFFAILDFYQLRISKQILCIEIRPPIFIDILFFMRTIFLRLFLKINLKISRHCESGNGLFLNDVMQVEGWGSHFCDTACKYKLSTNLSWTERGEGVKETLNMRDLIYERPPPNLKEDQLQGL